MVEDIRKGSLPVNRKQGTVLTSVGYSQEEFENYASWVGFVKFVPGERETLMGELEQKGLVVKDGDSLKLTPDGQRISGIVDIAFSKED